MSHRGISAVEQDGTAAADYRNYKADIKQIKCKAEYLGGKIQRFIEGIRSGFRNKS